ncbi:hypothetical protein SUDANB121_01968 [Nocardiopsis dassonvillei]|uniref:DUF4153 domain-containing protein n=1 Tax=Nocardiopsis dassonvillei TaxID=2014 RepID=UPI003F564C0D
MAVTDSPHPPPPPPRQPHRPPHGQQPPYPPYLPPSYRPKPPLPPAPAWLLIAVLAVGAFSALFAALARPGLGLVLTGALAGLAALVALLVRPAIPEVPADEDDDEDGPGAGAGAAGGAPPGAGTEDKDPTPADTGASGGADTADGTPPETGPEDGDPRPPAQAEAGPGGEADNADGTPSGAGAEGGDPQSPADTGARDRPAGPAPSGWNGWEPAPGGGWRPAGSPVEEDGEPDRYSHTWSAVFGVVAAALLLTALFRDAGWLLFWTLGGAFLSASLAFAVRGPGSRTGTVGVVSGAFALVRNLFSTPRFLLEPLRGGRTRRLVLPVLLTALVTGALLLVFGLLFAFADPVFARHLGALLGPLTEDASFFGSLVRVVFLLVTALFTGSAVLTARLRSPAPAARAERETGLPVWAWTIPLGALTALFAAFLAVQAVTLFGGDDYVQRVAGVTYAEYARQGFFQLVAVSVLVLGVIGLSARILPSRPRGVRLLRNALLGALCVLTLVILASAMYRLQLYIDVFGLTRLRTVAEAWIFWSALVFALVLAAGVLDTLGRPAVWLPRVVAATAGVSLAVFAYANPDLRIAESHLGTELNGADLMYLKDLSADAVPALVRLEEPDRDCVLADDHTGHGEDGFASWNLSRERAEALLPPPPAVTACGDRYGYGR